MPTVEDAKVKQKNLLQDLIIAYQDNFDEISKALSIEKSIRSRLNLPKNNSPVVVKLESVFRNYKLGKEHIQAVNDVSIEIKEGEFVALTGPSGSGKSTLLQLIGGLDKPTKGKLIINSQDISKLSDRKLSNFRNKTVGFVFQFFYLQPFLTTRVNLEVPAMFARTHRQDRLKRVNELADAVGLKERLDHLPKELSGGQTQRAAIVRALLNNPKLLLADEPTGNLDKANGDAIIELFDQIRKKFGTTIVIVTHDAEIAARTDREIRLLDGRVQA
jgi:ABC-type lipoprotein export system ATPase subunit